MVWFSILVLLKVEMEINAYRAVLYRTLLNNENEPLELSFFKTEPKDPKQKNLAYMMWNL